MSTGVGSCKPLLRAAAALMAREARHPDGLPRPRASITRLKWTPVSQAQRCPISRDAASRNYYKTSFLPSSAALMSQEAVIWE